MTEIKIGQVWASNRKGMRFAIANIDGDRIKVRIEESGHTLILGDTFRDQCTLISSPPEEPAQAVVSAGPKRREKAHWNHASNCYACPHCSIGLHVEDAGKLLCNGCGRYFVPADRLGSHLEISISASRRRAALARWRASHGGSGPNDFRCVAEWRGW